MFALKPVIICGYPKSGTTLLVSLLDAHPELLVYPEELKFRQVLEKASLEEKVGFILSSTGARYPAMGLVDFPSGQRDYTSIDGEQYLQDLTAGLRQAESDKALLEAIYENWLHHSRASDPGRLKYFVEKTPGNEHLYRTFTEWYPEARFIHIVRDPRDNFASYHRKQPTLHLLEFADAWRESARLGLSLAGADNYRCIRYEDLAAQPEQVMKDLSEFLHIPFDPVLLQPTRFGSVWEGNSMFGDNQGRIHQQASGRYRQRLSEKQIGEIENYAGVEMKALSYTLDLTEQNDRMLDRQKRQLARVKNMRNAKSRVKQWLGVSSHG